MKKLTLKQERFCYEYLTNGLNGTEAAIKAGYTPRSAKVTASRLLTNANVESKINQTRKEVAESAGITLHRVVRELSKLAFNNVVSFYDDWFSLKPFDQISEDQKAAIQEIGIVVRKRNVGTRLEPVIIDVEYSTIKTHDKCRAIDLICRIFGFYTPQKVEIPAKGPLQGADFSKLTTQELNQLLKLLEKAYDESIREYPKEAQN